MSGWSQGSDLESFKFNSHYDEFAPGYIGNKFVFCSDRRDNTFVSYADRNGNNRSRWYSVDENGNEKKFEIPGMKSFYQMGPFSWNQSKNELCFTATSFLKNGSEAVLGLYFVNLNSDGTWDKSYPFEHNSKALEYSIGHPTYSVSGDTLYFVSDMEGGLGGTDICYSVREGEFWSAPVNMGPEVNSPFGEYYPTIDENGKLAFSSNRSEEKTGYDLYQTVKTKNGWQSPLKLDAPYNSDKDDFSLVMKKGGGEAYLVSNRKHLSLEILKLRETIPTFERCSPSESPAFCYRFYEEGIDASRGLPLKYVWSFGDGTKEKGLRLEHCYADYGTYNVALTLIDTLRDEVYGVISQFQIEIEPTYKPHLRVRDSLAVGETETAELDVSQLTQGKVVKKYWFLDGEYAGRNEYIDFQFDTPGFHEVKIGVVLEDEFGNRSEVCNSTVIQVFAEEEKANDDGLGNEMAMTVKRKNDMIYFVEFFESDWQVSKSDPLFEEVPYSITERQTQDSSYHYSVGQDKSPYALYDTYLDMVKRGFEESKVMGENLAEFKRQILSEGGYVYDQEKKQMLSFVQSLADIQFEANSANILDKSMINLEKVRDILLIDEGFRLFISAHTDNIGEEAYNMDLSERRAQSVLDYLVSNGIEAERLRTKGFGEAKPIRENTTEAGRFANRRVEFRLFFVE